MFDAENILESLAKEEEEEEGEEDKLCLRALINDDQCKVVASLPDVPKDNPPSDDDDRGGESAYMAEPAAAAAVASG